MDRPPAGDRDPATVPGPRSLVEHVIAVAQEVEGLVVRVADDGLLERDEVGRRVAQAVDQDSPPGVPVAALPPEVERQNPDGACACTVNGLHRGHDPRYATSLMSSPATWIAASSRSAALPNVKPVMPAAT